jgi:hypothetical protein
MTKWNSVMMITRMMIILLLGAVLVVSTGCEWDDRQSPEMQRFDEVFGTPQTRTIEVSQVVIYFVELPIGTSEDAQDLWGMLRRPAMPVDENFTLADNGLEVGVGLMDNWDRFQDVLLSYSAVQYSPRTLIGRPGVALRPQIVEHTSSQTVFLVHQDQTLSGWDFPPGEFLLSMLFRAGGDDESLVVTGVPVVRTRARRSVMLETEESISTQERPLEYSLNPLAFQMRIPSDSFIVVGASSQARRISSFGRCLLRRERDGVPVETMLIIIPGFAEREVEER